MGKSLRSVRALVLAAVLSAAAAYAPSASATVVVPLSREELVAQSDLIVRATVVSRRYGWNDDHSQIVTWTRLRVTEYVMGAGAQELTLRQFGGAIDGIESAVSGDARLEVGQHAVLFLRNGPGVVFLTALSQAAFLVQVDPGQSPVVRRSLEGLSFARLTPAGMTVAEPPTQAPEALDRFVRDVRSLARRAGR